MNIKEIKNEIETIKMVVLDAHDQIDELKNQCKKCRDIPMDKEPEELENPENNLILMFKIFSIMVKDYVMQPCDELENAIEKLHQKILPFLVEGSPRYNAVFSLKNYMKNKKIWVKIEIEGEKKMSKKCREDEPCINRYQCSEEDRAYGLDCPYPKEEKKEIKIFELNYLDIPISDMEQGEIIVCLDPQKRLGEKTWSVVKHYEGSPNPLGLFWDKEEAVKFASIK